MIILKSILFCVGCTIFIEGIFAIIKFPTEDKQVSEVIDRILKG